MGTTLIPRACALILVGLVAGAGGCKRARPGSYSDIGVKSAMAQAVKMLEAKDYAGFAKRFIPPDELAKELNAGRTPDHIGRDLVGDPNELIARIRAVKGMKPTFSEQGKKAVYVTHSGGRVVRLAFVKIDGRWYLA